MSHMATQNLLLFLVVGVVAGFLAGKIMKGSGYGLVGDLVVGVVGSSSEPGSSAFSASRSEGSSACWWRRSWARCSCCSWCG